MIILLLYKLYLFLQMDYTTFFINESTPMDYKIIVEMIFPFWIRKGKIYVDMVMDDNDTHIEFINKILNTMGWCVHG